MMSSCCIFVKMKNKSNGHNNASKAFREGKTNRGEPESRRGWQSVEETKEEDCVQEGKTHWVLPEMLTGLKRSWAMGKQFEHKPRALKLDCSNHNINESDYRLVQEDWIWRKEKVRNSLRRRQGCGSYVLLQELFFLFKKKHQITWAKSPNS